MKINCGRLRQNTFKYLTCSRQVLDKRRILYKRSFVQSSVGVTSDIIVENVLNKNSDFMTFDYIHYMDNYIATYILSSIIFFIFDSIEEFKECSEDICNIE